MKSKKILKIAIQMDKLQYINKETDSTLALIEEAFKRKFIIYIYTVDNLSLIENVLVAKAQKILNVSAKKINFLDLGKFTDISLKNFDVVLIRQDPPFNMQYITATYLLEKLPSSCKVLNNPTSIRNCPEKIFVTNFSHLMPPTIITREISEINSFIEKNKNVVVKPLFGNGGSNVFYITKKDPNRNIIIENLLIEKEHIIIQKFINKVSLGDKRILLLNGEPVGAVNRVPKNNEIRANLHIGGKAKKTKLTERDYFICSEIKEAIKTKGLFFSGIDIIDGYLTEINVTSPTCIREIDLLNSSNISKLFWNEVLKLN